MKPLLISRKLDDQSYADIVAEAEGRLPWLCPVCTDHNAHDPGITILELMAWYKEMQQFQMDQLTPAIQRMLLGLTGTSPLRARPAECALEYPPDAPSRPALSRLGNRQEVCFELAEAIPENRARLERIDVCRGDRQLDALGLLRSGMGFMPFKFAGKTENSFLRLGFARLPRERLRLWFEIVPPEGVPRNPADGETLPPRSLVWEAGEAGELEPLADETLALSWSGYVTLPVPKNWKKGKNGLYWLSLSQKEGGCEEEVRISGVSAGRYRAVQQETRAKTYAFRVPTEAGARARLESAQATDAELAVFLRIADGWTQSSDYTAEKRPYGLLLTVNAARAAQDGKVNLRAVCLDPLRIHDLLFDAKGLPGESFFLNLGETRALPDRLSLMCQTVQRDGTVRPAPWRCVEDLSLCSPRDRVFVYDAGRETITFGDGEHGAVPAPGTGAVMVTNLVLSLCGGGNIPEHSKLVFQDDGTTAANGAATGGRDPETLREARARMLRTLGRTVKCLSAGDYAQRAKETPGLRVAGAKALPGFDPDVPHVRAAACVTVVVLPAGEGPKPRADRRFLAAVERQLNRRRTICIRTRAVPARYVPFSVSLRLLTEHGAEESVIRASLERHFAAREERIGEPARKEDTEALLQALPGVLQVRGLEFRGLDQASYRTETGDLRISPDEILSLERMDVALTRL
ncbi:MAG: baseplate J/gp47 family protein [Oscillospiraceae bacterium]|nr:baseplate J/gp47 family protein [Oscillospiraceae bacterium]